MTMLDEVNTKSISSQARSSPWPTQSSSSVETFSPYWIPSGTSRLAYTSMVEYGCSDMPMISSPVAGSYNLRSSPHSVEPHVRSIWFSAALPRFSIMIQAMALVPGKPTP